MPSLKSLIFQLKKIKKHRIMSLLTRKQSGPFPYVCPFAVFMILIIAGDVLPLSPVFAYPMRTLIVGVLLIYFFPSFMLSFKPHWLWSIGCGMLVFFLWVALEGWVPLLGKDTVLNPYEISSGKTLAVWFVIRMIGAVVVVSIMEEVFWRGFLWRWLQNVDFKAVPHGQFQWLPFLITSGLFAIEHNRWLPGLLAGLLFNMVYCKTKSLTACIIAHAVANACLGAYVIKTEQWQFW